MNCVVYIDLKPFKCAQFLDGLKLLKLGNFLWRWYPSWKAFVTKANIAAIKIVVEQDARLSVKDIASCTGSKTPMYCQENRNFEKDVFNSSGPVVQVPSPFSQTVTGRFYKNSVLKKVKEFYNKKRPSKWWSVSTLYMTTPPLTSVRLLSLFWLLKRWKF